MKLRRIKTVEESSYKKNRRKRKIKRIIRFFNTILITALFTTTIVYTALSPFFNIERIDAFSSLHYNSEELTAISGIYAGENGFRLVFENPKRFYLLRIASAEKRIIERCPYVKSAKVKFIIPSTVTVEVIERKAAAVLSLEGTSFIIDKEGYLLDINSQEGTTDIPVFKGIESDLYDLGNKIINDDEKLEIAFEIYDNLKEAYETDDEKWLSYVDFIDVEDINGITLSLESRITVDLGKADELNYKINAIKAILNNNIKKDEKGKLDFSLDGKIVFTPEDGG